MVHVFPDYDLRRTGPEVLEDLRTIALAREPGKPSPEPKAAKPASDSAVYGHEVVSVVYDVYSGQ